MWSLTMLLLSQFVPAETLHLVAGRSVERQVVSQQVVCDDPAVVSVSLSEDRSALVFTALRKGSTRCSYGQIQGPRFVLELEVMSVEEAVTPVATKLVDLTLNRLSVQRR